VDRLCVETPGAVDNRGRKEDFFFEKKKQKTFGYLDGCWSFCSAQMDKSFLLLFFKKEVFLTLSH
jgi:hypothetical protein